MITVYFTTSPYETSVRIVDQFVFNDGSVQVEIKDFPEHDPITYINILAKLRTPADQMALVMTVNAIRSSYPTVPLDLTLPFTPYGRQDAVMVPGQANAMKAWAGVLNSLNFCKVNTYDPHSMAINMIDNVQVVDIVDIVGGLPEIRQALFDNVLVSPDAGANKKCHRIAQECGVGSLVRADKARDLATGNIIETELYGDVEGKECVIIDDICDGGMTFIKLAEKLKERGASKITLFVTHGLFSKGLGVFEDLIDDIYTTDTCDQDFHMSDLNYSGNFKVLNL